MSSELIAIVTVVVLGIAGFWCFNKNKDEKDKGTKVSKIGPPQEKHRNTQAAEGPCEPKQNKDRKICAAEGSCKPPQNKHCNTRAAEGPCQPPEKVNTNIAFLFSGAANGPNKQLLSYFANAESSICICAFTYSLPMLEEVVFTRRLEGVQVRILTSINGYSNSYRRLLSNSDIHLRYAVWDVIFKYGAYAIIDGRIVVSSTENFAAGDCAQRVVISVISDTASVADKMKKFANDYCRSLEKTYIH